MCVSVECSMFFPPFELWLLQTTASNINYFCKISFHFEVQEKFKVVKTQLVVLS